MYICVCGKCGFLVNVRDSILSPDLAHCIVFLDKALNSLSTFQVYKSLYIGAS